MTADDELNAGQAILQEDRMELETVAAIDVDQIMADLFAHDRVVAVTRDIDQHGGETAKPVETRNGAHPRTFAKRQDQFGIGRQAFNIDLEQLVARIFFQHVDERLARMVLAVEAEMLDDRIGLGTDERDARDRTRIGDRGEEADQAQFADGLALRPENLHADIIEIGAAMHQRKRVRLGDDQRLAAVEEIGHFARRHRVVAILAQNADLVIVKDAERFLDRNQFALVALALEGQFAKAEKDETVVAQPFEKRDRFRHRRVARHFVHALVIGDGPIEALQHRLPVADGGANLPQHTLDRGGQVGLGLLVEGRKMDLHQADALDALGRRKLRCLAQNDEFVLLAGNIQNRMHDHENLAGMIVQLTHDGVEQERHIVVDDGDDAHRATVAFDTVIDADDALALAPGVEGGIAVTGRTVESGGIVSGQIFRRRPFEEKLREGRKRLRLSSLLLLLACL